MDGRISGDLLFEYVLFLVWMRFGALEQQKQKTKD